MKRPNLNAISTLLSDTPDASRLGELRLTAPADDVGAWRAFGRTGYPAREATCEGDSCEAAAGALLRALSLGHGRKGRPSAPLPEIIEWLELGQGRTLTCQVRDDEEPPYVSVYHVALHGPDIDLEGWSPAFIEACDGCTIQSGWKTRARRRASRPAS